MLLIKSLTINQEFAIKSSQSGGGLTIAVKYKQSQSRFFEVINRRIDGSLASAG